jgi:hypothetical protein
MIQPCDQLTAKEIQVSTLVWQGLTNREIAKIIGTTEQVVKNYLRTAFDKLGSVEPAGTCPLRGQPRWRGLGRQAGGRGRISGSSGLGGRSSTGAAAECDLARALGFS